MGLAPMIAELGLSRRIIAPDMMGNGDSDPPPKTDMQIGDYVDTAIEVLDKLGIAKVDAYGDHTGANIVCELAIRHPERVRRVVMDGIALFEPALKAKLLAQYAPPMQPDEHGGHLAWAWHMVTELFWHFPYFERDPAHRLNINPVPPAAMRQRLATDVIKAITTYHIAYKAAFSYPSAERLPLVKTAAAIFKVTGDPLSVYAEPCAAFAPDAQVIAVTRDGKAAAVRTFLDA
jgi:pimeloyl-ACP methyl ester carboxylesterase